MMKMIGYMDHLLNSWMISPPRILNKNKNLIHFSVLEHVNVNINNIKTILIL